jgi:hypothetical protein
MGMGCTLLPNNDIPSLLRATLVTDAFYTSIHNRVQRVFGYNVTKDDTDALFSTDEWTSQLLSAETIETALGTMSNVHPLRIRHESCPYLHSRQW